MNFISTFVRIYHLTFKNIYEHLLIANLEIFDPPHMFWSEWRCFRRSIKSNMFCHRLVCKPILQALTFFPWVNLIKSCIDKNSSHIFGKAGVGDLISTTQMSNFRRGHSLSEWTGKSKWAIFTEDIHCPNGRGSHLFPECAPWHGQKWYRGQLRTNS